MVVVVAVAVVMVVVVVETGCEGCGCGGDLGCERSNGSSMSAVVRGRVR